MATGFNKTMPVESTSKLYILKIDDVFNPLRIAFADKINSLVRSPLGAHDIRYFNIVFIKRVRKINYWKEKNILPSSFYLFPIFFYFRSKRDCVLYILFLQ